VLLSAVLVCGALAGGALAGAQPAPDDRDGSAAALTGAWAGVYDDLEQVVFDADASSSLMMPTDRHVRTVVAPVSLPWLGEHVLYLEEFVQDDPQALRRQLLLRPEDVPGSAVLVRVRQYSFREPWRWQHLHARVELLDELRAADLQSLPACDLLLTRQVEQFRGGTTGRGCTQARGATQLYVDYRVLLGAGLYWYRKRLLRVSDDELVSETVAYDWFELHQARLYACRVRWASGASAQPAPLTVLELQDQGGRARFFAPDGRSYELELHSRDWPFDADRAALLLVLRQLGPQGALVSSWAGLDAAEIDLQLAPLSIRCGPLAPSREFLPMSYDPRALGSPAAAAD